MGNPIQMKQKDVAPLREKLLKAQKGLCPICGNKIIRPVLDHHHVRKVKGTGQIRGVICSGCNTLLGKIENNSVRFGIAPAALPRVLMGMAKYITGKQYPYIHPSEAPKPKQLKKSSYNELVKTLKDGGFRNKIPPYPKSKRITKQLEKLFDMILMVPEFYKRK